MDTDLDPKDLVRALLDRSTCAVQVAAVLVDHFAIHSWGWNSAGPRGLGQHAEAHCFRRANWDRVYGSTLYVAARRQKNGNRVTAKPCEQCQKLVRFCRGVVYRDGKGEWISVVLPRG